MRERKFKFKFKLYKHLQESIPKIYEEARRAADEIGIPKEIRGKFGLTGAISSCHGLLTRKVAKAMDDAAREVVPNKVYDEELREVIKSYYGDDYDALAINTCEAALWLCFDVLVTPPFQGRGYNYRSRYIALYERHLHHQGGYGRPFPPKYKDLFADRGCTAGELGFYGKRLENLDVIYVPLVGARYEVHGIKYHPVPLLSDVDPKRSLEVISMVAERHAHLLGGFSSLAYDTPGYGYGAKDEDGTPLLQKGLASLSKEFNVPYILDNAWGVPFIGSDIRKIGGDAILYSMDKAAGSPTVGLIIGREDVMVPLRRALGTHGDRWGTVNSYGKAAYVTFDPGKEALVGLIAALKELLENPGRFTKVVDRLYEMTLEEFDNIHPDLKREFKFAKSYNSGAVEINYDRTWVDGLGLPIFSIEDMYSGTNILQSGLSQMGIIPTIAYDANIFISPGLGTTDEDGNLIEDRMRLAIRGLVKLIEIVAKYAGLI